MFCDLLYHLLARTRKRLASDAHHDDAHFTEELDVGKDAQRDALQQTDDRVAALGACLNTTDAHRHQPYHAIVRQ